MVVIFYDFVIKNILCIFIGIQGNVGDRGKDGVMGPLGPSGIKGKYIFNKVNSVSILNTLTNKKLFYNLSTGDKGAPGYAGFDGIDGIKVNIKIIYNNIVDVYY